MGKLQRRDGLLSRPPARSSAVGDGDSRRGDGTERAVSEITGIILLFGIVVTGVALLAVTGFVALDAVQSQTAEERSIQKMDVVRGGVENVQYGQQEHFEDVWATETQGTMTLEVNGDSDTRTELEMGAFLHQHNGAEYASQAGGTWTETDDGSRMIHEPTLDHSRTTVDGTDVWSISLPPVEIEERTPTSGDGVVAGYESYDDPLEERLFEHLSDDEPLRVITITIEDSPYQDAWARYLEDEFPTHREDSYVRQDGDTLEAAAPLGEGGLLPDDPERYDLDRTTPPGSLATSATNVDLTNTDVDSYDSAAKAYDDHTIEERRHGVLEAAGDVTLSGGQTEVKGDVYAGGTIDISGGATISPGNGTEDWEDFTEPESITDDVDAIVSDIGYYPDRVNNDETAAIDDTTFVGGDDLESGVYYLEEATIDDDLTIDASEGDVVIAVDGDLSIKEDVHVTTGDSRTNEVRWFVRDDVKIDADVTVDDDRAPQHWLFGGDETTTTLEGSSSFTGAIYTPGNSIDISEGAQGGEGQGQSEPTTVYGALIGDVEAATNAHFAYDRALDRDPRVVNDGGIGGPNHPFDAQVTLAGADFAWNPQISETLDFLDPLNLFDPGERDDFEVDLPDEAFEHVGDHDGELEYFQTATGTTTVEENPAEHINGSTSYSELDFFEIGDADDERELDVDAGESITITSDNNSTELTVAKPGLLFDEEIGSGQGHVEVTADETTTLELGVGTNEERDYSLEIERTRNDDEITFNATEYDEFRVNVSSSDADFYVELREEGEPVQDEGYLFDGDALWTGDAGEKVSEEYAAYRDDTSFHGGQGTIRIGSRADEPIDYEVTLEQTEVDSSFFDVGGDPPWHQQFPIETELQFRNETEATAVQPWPEEDLEDHSNPDPAHENDVNHPAVEYPLTYELEELSPGTMFAPNVTWRDDFCTAMDSYAGTWRTPANGTYEDDFLFEMGCSAEDHGWFSDDPEYDMNQTLDGFEVVDDDGDTRENRERIKILQDGDTVPEIGAFEGQYTLEMMLDRASDDPDDSMINESGSKPTLDLEDGEFILLFELAPEEYLGDQLSDLIEERHTCDVDWWRFWESCDPMDDYDSLWEYYDETEYSLWEDAKATDDDAPDFNDMVMLFEITDVHDDVIRFDGLGPDYRDTFEGPTGVITADDG